MSTGPVLFCACWAERCSGPLRRTLVVPATATLTAGPCFQWLPVTQSVKGVPGLLSAGASNAGNAGWEALAALWAGWAPPSPAAANSGFQRRALGGGRPLLFESSSWRVELCPQTGAIVGLSAGSGWSSGSVSSSASSAGSHSGGSSTDPSLLSSLLSKLQQPASLVHAAAGTLWGQQGQRAEQQQQQQAQQEPENDAQSDPGRNGWASFDAPLAMPVYRWGARGGRGCLVSSGPACYAQREAARLAGRRGRCNPAGQ